MHRYEGGDVLRALGVSCRGRESFVRQDSRICVDCAKDKGGRALPIFLEARLPKTLERVELLPLSDVHCGDANFKAEAFDALLKWVLAEPQRYVFLNGDLIDAATRHSVGDVYNAQMNPQSEKKWIIEKLKPLAKDCGEEITLTTHKGGHRQEYKTTGRLLGVTTGNHEFRLWKDSGADPSEDIALALDIPYCAEGCIVALYVGRADAGKGKRHDQAPVGYTVYITHGAGGGRRPGAKANRLEDLSLQVEGIDVAIVGHTHQTLTMANEVLVPDIHNKRVMVRDRVYVNSGSFLAWGGYAQTKGMTPGGHRMPVVELSGRTKEIRVHS